MRFASMRPRPNVCGSAHAWVAQEYIEDVRKTTESVQSAVVQACTLVAPSACLHPSAVAAARPHGSESVPAFATRSTCCARPQRIAKHTPERTPRAILCVVRRTATPDVAQHAPSLYVVSDVERAGPARPAGDHEPQACAGLARGARRLRRGQARARRVVRRAGPTVRPPSGAFASRCGRQGKAKAKEYSHFA